MLDELLEYPADTTGYVAIPRSVALVATLILVGFIPARVDNRLLLAGGSALVVYANWRMLGYSPSMHWRTVVEAGVLQGAGLGILMPVLTRTALSTLRPEFHPEGNVLINLSRLYGSTIGVAVVQTYFYYNTQSMHLALAKNLSPYRVLPLGETGLTRQSLMALNGLVTEQAAFVALVGQFKLLMVVMLIVSPLLLFLRRPGATGRRSRTPP
jgi:DHA2 family multidrug resistance protein